MYSPSLYTYRDSYVLYTYSTHLRFGKLYTHSIGSDTHTRRFRPLNIIRFVDFDNNVEGAEYASNEEQEEYDDTEENDNTEENDGNEENNEEYDDDDNVENKEDDDEENECIATSLFDALAAAQVLWEIFRLFCGEVAKQFCWKISGHVQHW